MWPFSSKKNEVKEADFSERIAHVAFIMDGNGRWAKKRGLPRGAGHRSGAESFRRTVDFCHRVGIRTVTVYAFSTENWSRPPEEVAGIMRLLEQFLDEGLGRIAKDDLRIVFLGDKTPLSPTLREKAEQIERLSLGGTYTLNIALNYGGRAELVHAANVLIGQGKQTVTEGDIAEALYTAHSPDPDLVIRTGGDYRISNFLLWQSAYAEYYFTPTLWPDLTEKELFLAFQQFCKRHRRFGGLGE